MNTRCIALILMGLVLMLPAVAAVESLKGSKSDMKTSSKPTVCTESIKTSGSPCASRYGELTYIRSSGSVIRGNLAKSLTFYGASETNLNYRKRPNRTDYSMGQSTGWNRWPGVMGRLYR